MISSILIGPIAGTLTGTSTWSQSGPESNGNEEILNTSQNSRIGSSQPDVV